MICESYCTLIKKLTLSFSMTSFGSRFWLLNFLILWKLIFWYTLSLLTAILFCPTEYFCKESFLMVISKSFLLRIDESTFYQNYSKITFASISAVIMLDSRMKFSCLFITLHFELVETKVIYFDKNLTLNIF